MPGIVDSHQHVWDPAEQSYPWLAGAPAVLRRRFDIEEFRSQIAHFPVVASVLVQAVNSAPETLELLAVAEATPVVAGVVGWVDLAAPDVAGQLERLTASAGGDHLVGVRHLVQDEPDPEWLARPDVVRGLRLLAEAGLAYDILVRTRELPAAIAAVDAVPEGIFVLDHGAKPEIALSNYEPWASLVARIASRPNVVCKLSGLVTEAGPRWTADRIAPYLDHLLASFGAKRLLFGSDWPVCTTVADYGEVVELALAWLRDRLSPHEVDDVMSQNALAAYRLSPRLPPP